MDSFWHGSLDFWGIEAAIILGLSTFIGTSGIDSEIFCEECNRWCDSSESFHFQMPEDSAAVEKLKDNAVEKLAECNRVSDDIFPRIDVKLFRCKS